MAKQTRKMAKRRSTASETVEDLLRDLAIIQLALARVPVRAIRTIVGVDMNRVARITKHVKIGDK